MNEKYVKTMLYAYPYIDSMVKRLEDKIINKAVASMFDISPSEEQCAQVIVMVQRKEDLKELKHLIELMIMKFPFSDFDYFDFKYFHIRPKEYYKDKIVLDRTYYRKQEKLLKKFQLIFSAIGGDDEWFKDKYMCLGCIRSIYCRVDEQEKKGKKKQATE